MARVLLIRHAEAAGQAFDHQLTPRGREQAEALSRWLQARYAIDRVLASSYDRARDTVAPLARDTGLSIEIEPRVIERRAGTFVEPREVWLETMRLGFADLDYRPDGGESGREAQARGVAALQDALAGENALSVIVSHGQLMTHTLDFIDPSFGFDGWHSLTNPDVYLIEMTEDGRLRFERVWEPDVRQADDTGLAQTPPS
jgi:2,3-bisphosphoglycerate-dependent phosphoglycerate mutase